MRTKRKTRDACAALAPTAGLDQDFTH
jgi:hypothetical protein